MFCKKQKKFSKKNFFQWSYYIYAEENENTAIALIKANF